MLLKSFFFSCGSASTSPPLLIMTSHGQSSPVFKEPVAAAAPAARPHAPAAAPAPAAAAGPSLLDLDMGPAAPPACVLAFISFFLLFIIFGENEFVARLYLTWQTAVFAGAKVRSLARGF